MSCTTKIEVVIRFTLAGYMWVQDVLYLMNVMLMDTSTQDEGTPLIEACMWGSTTTARVLLEHGAHVDHQDKKVRDLQHVHTL